LHHVDDAAEFDQRRTSGIGDIGNFRADAIDGVGFLFDKGGPFLVGLGHAGHPVVVEFVADIAFEKGTARHLVPFGQTQHLAAKRGQPAVERIELVDQKFDLVGVKLDAFDESGQFFAQIVIFFLGRCRKILAGSERFQPGCLQFREFLENGSDQRKFFQSRGLQGLFHLGERKGVVFLFLFDDALGAAFGQFGFLIIFAVGRFGILDLVIVLEGRAGGLLADFAVVIIAFFQIFRNRVFREHGVKIENFAQLHFAVVERGRPFDDRVEGGRTLAESPDHGVAACLDALGNGNLALAAEQFDGAHFAQIHADRIVGAIGCGLFRDGGGGFLFLVLAIDRFDFVAAQFFGSFLVILDDPDAHLRDRGHDVLDLFVLVLGQGFVQFIDRQIATLFSLGDQFLDGAIVQVDQRFVFGFGIFCFTCQWLRPLI